MAGISSPARSSAPISADTLPGAPMNAAVKSTLSALSGAQRAAILILALGEERGGKVLASLDEEDLPVVTRAMAEIGRVPPETVTRAIQDFLGRLARGDTVAGGLSAAARM